MENKKSQWDQLYAEFEKNKEADDELAIWRELPSLLKGNILQAETIAELLKKIATEEMVVATRTVALTRFFQVWFDNNVRRVGHDDPALSMTPWLLDVKTGGRKPHVLVVAANDGVHLKDGLALMKLGTLFPSSRCDGFDAIYVPPAQPNRWTPHEMAALERADFVCFVGRPSFFSDCPVLLGYEERLRFHLPPDPGGMSGNPITQKSRESFHLVREGPAMLGPLAPRHPAIDDGTYRSESALVQRFTVDWHGVNKAILFVAGTSSLGTAAAADWLTRPDHELIPEVSNVLSRFVPSPRETLEIRLKTRARSDAADRAWHAELTRIEAVVHNLGRNELQLAHTPHRAFAILRDQEPKSMIGFRLDDEFFDFDRDLESHRQLLALCLYRDRHPQMGLEISASALIATQACWPFDSNPIKFIEQAHYLSFRNNVRTRILNNAISVSHNETHSDFIISGTCEFGVKFCGK